VRRPAALAVATVALLCLAPGCKRKKAAEDVVLSQTLTTPSSRAVVHFPPDFSARAAGEHVTVLSPLASTPYDPSIEVHVSTNDKPVTNVVDEYAKILHKPFKDKYADWQESSHAATTCFKGFPGTEIVATYTNQGGKKMRYRSCAFFALGHGYWLAYLAPEGTFAADEPLLRKIVDATEIKE
jgi:hypothetical protein